MPLLHHVEEFTQFAASHLNGDQINDYHIQLKIDHTLRVLDNARAIVEGEHITGHVAELALFASLYHDIGRFPQFRDYGTFKDTDSRNHGRLGVLTLRELDLPQGISTNDWKTIRSAVGLHNVKKLNPRMSTDLATITKVVRDADKIDIYPVLIHHMDKTRNATKIVLHDLEDDPEKHSDAVLEAVMAEQVIDYSTLKYANDFMLLVTGWIFALNYITSVGLFARNDTVEKAFSLLPKDEKIQKFKEKILTFIHYNHSLAS